MARARAETPNAFAGQEPPRPKERLGPQADEVAVKQPAAGRKPPTEEGDTGRGTSGRAVPQEEPQVAEMKQQGKRKGGGRQKKSGKCDPAAMETTYNGETILRREGTRRGGGETKKNTLNFNNHY